MIRKGHLEDYEVLIPDDNSDNDDDDDEDISEHEETKLIMGKVGTKEHSIVGIALAVSTNYLQNSMLTNAYCLIGLA